MDTKTFTLNGLKFRRTVQHDEMMREPWKEHDGHGVISDWTSRDKHSYERILCSDRGGFHRFYDVRASMAIALQDGWGVANPEGKTRRQVAAEAVEADYQRMRAWCNDEWHWVYVTVELLGVDGEPIPAYREFLGGFESDDESGIEAAALEMAGDLAARVGDADAVSIAVRISA